MLPISGLLPDLVLMVPGCPEPTMERAIRDAAREFCRDAAAIIELTYPDTSPAGEGVMELAGLASAQKEISSLLEVRIDGSVIGQLPLDYLRGRVDYPTTAAGRPRAAFQTGPSQVTLWPTPDQAYDVQFLVSTAPTATATRLDPDLAGRWRSAVIHRAMAALAMQPDKSYTNPQLVAAGMALYRTEVSRARIEFNRSFGRSARVVPRGHAFL